MISCEKIAQKFIETDNFEIEIHNLNEVNEFFSIFKEKIIALQNQLAFTQQQSARASVQRLPLSERSSEVVNSIRQQQLSENFQTFQQKSSSQQFAPENNNNNF